jgi:nucleotide-binding universal stress UspA family protein
MSKTKQRDSFRGGAMTRVAKILAPIDFSSGSEASVEYAVALAKSLHSVVTLFHVYHFPDLMESIVPGADNTMDAEKDRAFAQQWLEKIGEETRKRTDIETHVVVVEGSPAREIISLSLRDGFDMVVMGTHGRTGLERVVMGSVAEAVVRGARCPVLTIHLPLPDRTA